MDQAAFEAALAKLEPQLRDAFLASIAEIRSSAQMALVIRAIEDGNIEAAVRALSIDPTAFYALDDAIRGAYLLGGRDMLMSLPVIPDRETLGKWFSASMERTPKRTNG